MNERIETLIELKHLLDLSDRLQNSQDSCHDHIKEVLYSEMSHFWQWEKEKLRQHCLGCKCTNIPPSRLDYLLKRLSEEKKRKNQ